MSEAALIGLFVATVQFATLVFLAALGELIAERAGVLNLGVEGMMAMGAVSGFMVGLETGSPWAAFFAAAAVGALVGGLHALVSVILGADQVVSGLALTIGGLGLAAYVGRNVVGERPETQFTDLGIAGLADIRWFGEIFFDQPPVVYLAVLLGLAVWFVLTRTRLGLALRAVGESAPTTDAVGHSVMALRAGAVMVGGAFAGAAGSFLSLYMAPGWTEGMVAGRGWIAVALVIFGAWRPGPLGPGGAVVRVHPGAATPVAVLRHRDIGSGGKQHLSGAARHPPLRAHRGGAGDHQLALSPPSLPGAGCPGTALSPRRTLSQPSLAGSRVPRWLRTPRRARRARSGLIS